MKEKEVDKLIPEIEQLSLAFQPIMKVTASSHSIAGYEILLRYQGGNCFPFEMFEELIGCKECCDRLNHWYEEQISACLNAYPDTMFSLNIDFQQLIYSSTRELLKTLSQFKERLTIELTEFHKLNTIENRDVFLNAMNFLKDLEMKISFDDVGNGQHSMVFVTENIHYVTSCKLSLIHFDHMQGATVSVIIDAWVKITEEFNVKLIVEGVENEATAKTLVDKGVKYQQGFYWSEPIEGKKDYIA